MARSPARLILALAVAAVLAVFLMYTAFAGASTPELIPSQVTPAKAGKLSVVGKVVGPVTGDSHSNGGLRFGLKDINAKSRIVPVVYRGDAPPPLFAVGRNVVVGGTYGSGQLQGSSILTKCPSKYTASPPKA
ncbi:MAG TPA: cytochrome c maturation protein CcmE [Gaiellaceae bacterium]|nr:cytochrome c maturation protein CcmE [Gaiellaceae bacterium]